MSKRIIGISGLKGSGKDTVAKMINYILATGITKANFNNFIDRYKNNNTADILNNRILHFADSLKQLISFLFNIHIDILNNHETKDSVFYCFETGKLYKKEEIINSSSKIITLDNLKRTTLNNIINNVKDKKHLHFILIRTLLQYIGTELFRTHVDENIWIRRCINQAIDIIEMHETAIIADVRFNNECEQIMQHSFYGGLIKVTRNKCIKDNVNSNSSENDELEYDYLIENNGTMLELFYKVQEIVSKIINK